MKLIPELQNRIIELIKGGNYNKTACEAVGITEKTYYNWMKKGLEAEEKFEKEEKLDSEEILYLQFLQSIKKAKAEAIAKNVLIIQLATRKDWKAAAWWLERTNFKDWGRKDFLKINSETTIKNANVEALEELMKGIPKEEVKDIIKLTGDAILNAIDRNKKEDKSI